MRTGGLGLADGLHAFAGGIGFVVTTPSVWGYALVPAAMLLVLLAAFAAAGAWGAAWFSGYLFGPDVGAWGWLGSWLVTAAVALVALVVGLFLALSLAQPLSGWALEAVAHAQEFALTGRRAPAPSFLAALFASLKVVALTLCVGGSVLAGLSLIGFFFPPALVVTVPLKFVVCAWLLAWDFCDYPLSLRGLGVRARLGWVARNFDAFCAFSLAWAALLVVPGMVLVLLPMGVAGATRLVVADEMSE
jgi:CysZ protein